MRTSNVTASQGPALTPQAKILGLHTELPNQILYTAATTAKIWLNVALTNRIFRAIFDSIALCINLIGRLDSGLSGSSAQLVEQSCSAHRCRNLAEIHQIRTNEVAIFRADI